MGSAALIELAASAHGSRIRLLSNLPFLAVHAGCLGVLWTGVSTVALAAAAAGYLARMFFITAFYHRYFSHRTFRAGRLVQFVMALTGTTAGQRGPIWWAAHHRHHHQHADDEPDLHSPTLRGFWMSHCGWFLTDAAQSSPERYARDWRALPELRLLDRFYWVGPALWAGGCAALGEALDHHAPQLGTGPMQMLVWGFCISTVLVYHATYCINSLAHRWGRRRFETPDKSRNSLILALMTLGEGWHNNHHRFPACARQGFRWWEIDISYYLLRALAALRIIRGLRPLPGRILEEARRADSARNGARARGAP